MVDVEEGDVGSVSEEASDTEQELLAAGVVDSRVLKSKVYANNEEGMEDKLKEFGWDFRKVPLSESMTIWNEIRDNIEEVKEFDVHDDMKREFEFYKRAAETAVRGIEELQKEGVPVWRPDDYFAEMVKTDVHMTRVKEMLVKQKKMIQDTKQKQKMREHRKFGKQMRHEKQKEKDAKRKEEMTGVKELKKSRKRGRMTREMRDTQFGFGGSKRRRMQNTADSSADMKDFSSAKIKSSFKNNKGGKKKRPGKIKRRQQASRR